MKPNALPELVSPAGNLSHLEAVISAGADAVYVGAKGLSGRPRFAELSIPQVRRAREMTSEAGKKLYLAVNASFPWEKEKETRKTLQALSEIKPDAFIVGDLGVLKLIQEMPSHPPLHASTFLGIYSPAGAAWAKENGFTRVVLNTNLCLDEISALTRSHPEIDFELIAYGPICFNDNHRCNLPHGFRPRPGKGIKEATFSADLTFCQMRLKASLGGKTIKSGRLLCWPMIDLTGSLGLFTKIGVGSFKIAGRERETGYVASATAFMRSAIDRLQEEGGVFDSHAYTLHYAYRRTMS